MSHATLSAVALKAKLAEATVNAAKTGKVVKIGDGGGLSLNVRPNGGASWVLRFTHGAERKDLTLGQWPVVGLKDARDLASSARLTSLKGIDPQAQRRQERAKKTASEDTVRALFEDWHGKLICSDVYRDNIEAAFLKDVLPVIGDMAPQDVERVNCIGILRTIEDRKSLAMVRRVRMWMRQMFDFAIDDESRPLVTASPVPMGTLKSFGRRKARHFPAIVNVEEVGPLMSKIRAIKDNWIIRTALMLSAYVWQRPTEIREAVWEEFDLDSGIWKIPAKRMKMQEEHWVPLATQVVAMLKHYQGIVGSEGWLFPGRRYGKSISEGTLLGRLITMGYEHKHTPHGFRAMARTILDEKLKFDPRFMETQLSHVIDKELGGAYNRAAYWDDRVTMMQAWADWLDAQR